MARVPRFGLREPSTPYNSLIQGDWHNDEREGQGKLTYADGKVYIGGFVAGKKHGQGEERHPNGTVVNGYWEEGKLIKKLS